MAASYKNPAFSPIPYKIELFFPLEFPEDDPPELPTELLPELFPEPPPELLPELFPEPPPEELVDLELLDDVVAEPAFAFVSPLCKMYFGI